MTEQEQNDLNKQLYYIISNHELRSVDFVLKEVKKLLDNGADVNVTADMDMTALHLASVKGYFDVVKELVERGANINAKNVFGTTAIRMCTNYPEIVQYLLDKGALVDLYILSQYPKSALKLSVDVLMELVHEQMRMEDKWASAFMLIVREQDNYKKEDFKKYVLDFIDNTKTKLPDNIRIILNTLI